MTAEDKQENVGAVSIVDDDSKSADVPNLKGDYLNVFLLLLLYTMQNINFGIAIGVPILLQSNKNVTFKDQALFSLVTWPYSFKLIWAPLVDALYIQKAGRRKSWLIPVQYSIGACFIYMAYNIDEWLPETGTPDILKLTYGVFFVAFLSATQDIVIDGWALTILKKNNVSYASTCNAIGQAMGILIGSISLVLFTSENFCNKYLRFASGTGGIVTKGNLFYVWGIQFMFITTLIAIFKKEKDNRKEDNYIKLNIVQNYLLLWDILKMPSIQVVMIAFLTAEMGFATTRSNLSILELINAGVPKDNIAVVNSTMYVAKIITPLAVSKYTTGPKPMSIYLKATPIRLIWNITFAVFVYYTTTFIKINETVDFPVHYYAILVIIFIIHNILIAITGVAKSSLFNRISDPRFGGTYSTLFNTFSNLGNSSASSLAFVAVDFLTFKECSSDLKNNCSTSNSENVCKLTGGGCITTVNGYYVETALCVLIGVVWYIIFKRILKRIQIKNSSHWLVKVKKSVENNETNQMYTQ